jgi:PKD repeat protein
MHVNAQHPNLTPMNHTFRTMLLACAALFGLAAFAQPTPPYPILITGVVQGCMPNSQVTIESMPNTQPNWIYTLDLVNCGFDTLAWMQSPGGGFIITVPCNGGLLTSVGQYQVGPSGSDSIMVVLNCSNGGTPDCLGVPGGSALPGTACTTFLGEEGTWNTNCQCEPNTLSCQACFTVMSNSPWTATFMNCSTGSGPFTYQWWLPNGDASSSQNADWTFTSEGFYGVCLTIADASGCTSALCDTVYVDANGGISTGVNYIDCLGVPNGSALTGTSCTTLLGEEGTWNTNCQCEPNVSSCEACFTVVSNSPWTAGFLNCSTGNAPLSYQWWLPDGTSSNLADPSFSFNGWGIYGICLIISDANGCSSTMCDTLVVDMNGNVTIGGNAPLDCLGVPNGPNMPGAPCGNPSDNTAGIWSTDCICDPFNNTQCQAGFWVIQAYEGDSLNGEVTPIPNEVWVWNLSSGSSPFQFLWSFGDGTTSTDPYPTHIYAQSGPYELCLTLSDAAGCTSTYCDEVSIDENGIYNGMVIDGRPGSLRSGFTIRVREEVSTGMREAEALTELSTWPNPVSNHLNLSFRSNLRGAVQLELVDVNGRVHRTTNTTFTTGENRIELPTSMLPAGMYLLRIEQDGNMRSIRFVKD